MPIDSTSIPTPQRWSQPYDEGMSQEDVAQVLAMAPFSAIDPERFPDNASLTDILLNDARIRRHVPGDIIVREGDYGSSAFFVLSGSVRVVVAPGLPAGALGRLKPVRKGLFRSLWQSFRSRGKIEFRDMGGDESENDVGRRVDRDDDTVVFLRDVPAILEKHKTARLSQGDMFGEIAALSRTPRTASVFSETETTLLEIRWQGLRDIMRRAPELKAHIINLYRERSLKVHLSAMPIFSKLTDEQLDEVAGELIFETYGDFEWHTPYKSIAARDLRTVMTSEPVIAEEGHYTNYVLLIREGFARVTEKVNHGQRTVNYLRSGDFYGFDEMYHNCTQDQQVPHRYTLRAVGYVDLLRIPRQTFEKFIIPSFSRDQLVQLGLLDGAGHTAGVATGLTEFLVENRFINGTSAMMINLDRCVQCDDCVRACAAGHDNNPRFVRHGKVNGPYMVVNACMHCSDPVCMIGCPTGAIQRDRVEGQVVINDPVCIGCGTCANSCPYNNIRMVEVRDENNNYIVDASSRAPIVKATKCDLCRDHIGGPACQRACPHDAMLRLDFRDNHSLSDWVNR